MLTLISVPQASAATIAYSVNITEGPNDLDGTITTDGTIGLLASSNITAWSLTISSSGAPVTLTGTPGNSVLSLTSMNLSATSTALSWNFSGPMGSLMFEGTGMLTGDYAAFVSFGDASGGVFQTFILGSPRIAELTSGCQVIASTTTSATPSCLATTPLPAALPLFVTGLGALGLLGWRRKRKAAAQVAA